MLLSNVSSAVYSTASYLFYFIMSFVIPSSSGLATLSMGIMAPLADFAGVSRHIIVIGFSAANAVVGFLAPTCGLLMGVLAMCKIPLSICLETGGRYNDCNYYYFVRCNHNWDLEF